MQRKALDLDRVHPSIHTAYNGFNSAVVNEVSAAVERDAVVVVGMATNVFVKQARKSLTEAGIPFTYLEYGGYLSKWKERLAIKMWSGWPTFPQVFVHGRLVGGANDLKKLMADDQLKVILNAGR